MSCLYIIMFSFPFFVNYLHLPTKARLSRVKGRLVILSSRTQGNKFPVFTFWGETIIITIQLFHPSGIPLYYRPYTSQISSLARTSSCPIFFFSSIFHICRTLILAQFPEEILRILAPCFALECFASHLFLSPSLIFVALHCIIFIITLYVCLTALLPRSLSCSIFFASCFKKLVAVPLIFSCHLILSI